MTAAFWDRRATTGHTTYWAEYPVVRRYVNECVTDAWWAYPTHGFKAAWAYKPLGRGLSIGCGSGLLERDLRWLRICEEADAYDISPESIRLARNRAATEGIDRVRFEVADCERIVYGADRYDAVFFHGSLHHMSDPASLLDRIRPSLRQGGLLFLDDYVGPSREEWTLQHLGHAQRAYEDLPRAWRTVDVLPPPYDASDPSEMLRSSQIVAAVKARFEILWERPYWGNLLFPILSQVNDAAARRPESEPLLERLIVREKDLVQSGEFREPLFVWIVGRVLRA